MCLYIHKYTIFENIKNPKNVFGKNWKYFWKSNWIEKIIRYFLFYHGFRKNLHAYRHIHIVVCIKYVIKLHSV